MWKHHRITIDTETHVPSLKEKSTLLRQLIRGTLDAEGIISPCEINVLFTDDAGIQEINREQREIDAVTDVLSFPMLDLVPDEVPDPLWAEPDTGLICLGDMVLNFDRMKAQAVQFGHSVQRELAYLVVHSVLHLLGYDHMDEGTGKKQMRQREEAILEGFGILRENQKEG